MIAGIEWVVNQVSQSQATSIMQWVLQMGARRISTKAHQNSYSSMSITGGLSQAVHQAIGAALSKLPQMLHVVAAAGNSAADACDYTPGSASQVGAITVAATDADDAVPGFSNFGRCVTLWAPGTGIVSVGIGEPMGKGIKSMSGTSMSAPLVTGVSAAFDRRSGLEADD